MKNPTRYESRKVSRNRLQVQRLNPCSEKASNPFAHLLSKMSINENPVTPEERQIQHEVRMAKQNANAIKRKKQLAKRNKD